MNVNIKDFYIGTSGLLLPVPNKQFYPLDFKDKSRLHYYSSLTNSIEINSSFYKIPMQSTVKRWSEDVPANFKFTFKLVREITHFKKLAFDPKMVADFFKSINAIGDKKGCVLVQLPPSVCIGEFRQLDLLLECIKGNNLDNEWKIAVEFRHSSLYVDEVYELLSFYKFAMVIHHKPTAFAPIALDLADFVYLRFHGPDGDYRGNYEDNLMHEFALYAADWLNYKKEVFVYFNNTMGKPHDNLNTLNRLVNEYI